MRLLKTALESKRTHACLCAALLSLCGCASPNSSARLNWLAFNRGTASCDLEQCPEQLIRPPASQLDPSLQNTNLQNTNLQNTNLQNTNLQNTNLQNTNQVSSTPNHQRKSIAKQIVLASATTTETSDEDQTVTTDRQIEPVNPQTEQHVSKEDSSDIELIPVPAPDPIDVVDEEQDRAVVQVQDVIASIHSTFPLLQAAYQENVIAAGKQLAATGEFDTKLKASTENQPLGFYETYRHKLGLSQPIYQGGEVFGGYRIGRGGLFEPWYLERETNEGGEFKAGFNIPLLRNREIDARRAELWRATYDRQRADPEIRSQLILFVRDGSVMYWKWVAAAQQYEIGRQALEFALQRNDQLKRRVEEGDIDPPILTDNERSIAKREAKLVDLQRKLQQAAIKLSLFYRTGDGAPLIPDVSQVVTFPEPVEFEMSQIDRDTALAISIRPELLALDLVIKRVQVDLAEACNDTLPELNAQLIGSQDMGEPASSKRDKSQFELEAGLFVEVPLQRRKGLGKAQAARGKLVQLTAKRRFTVDKIRTEIESTYAALTAAFERLKQARISRRLAEQMAEIERRKFQLGAEKSNLFSVALREQDAVEAAEAEVDALLEYYTAKADYQAAMAQDWPQ